MGNSTSVGWVFSFCLVTASSSFLNISESENCGFWVYWETKSEQKEIQPVPGISKRLETQFFKYFRIRKQWVPGLLKEKKIRIKYLPVLGISKPQRPANFHKTTRKELADFLGGQFFACFKVLENQGCMWKTRCVWFSDSCGYASWEPPWYPGGFGCWVQFLISTWH